MVEKGSETRGSFEATTLAVFSWTAGAHRLPKYARGTISMNNGVFDIIAMEYRMISIRFVSEKTNNSNWLPIYVLRPFPER